MKLLALFVVLSFCVGCASDKKLTPAKQAELHMRIGSGYLKAGNYPRALSEFLTAQELDANNAIVQNNLGIAYYVRGHFAKAEKHLRNAVRLRPKYTDARNNLGRTLIELELFNEAIKELKVATKDLTYQEPEKTFSNLGIAYYKSGKFKSAKKNLTASLKIRSNHCQTSLYLAKSLFELKDYGSASLAFDQNQKKCKEASDSSEALYFSALSFYHLKQREQSYARFEEVIQKYPNSEHAGKAKEMLDIIER